MFLSIHRMQFSQPCSKVVAQSESFSTNSHKNEILRLMRKHVKQHSYDNPAKNLSSWNRFLGVFW